MVRYWMLMLALGMSMTLGACSSTQTSETGDETAAATETEDTEQVADAGTDAVPQESAETPAADAETAPTEIAEAPTDASAVPEATTEEASPAEQPAEGDTAMAPPAEEPPLAESPPPPAAEPAVAQSETPAPVAAEPKRELASLNNMSGLSGKTESYTVQEGDTLMKIAFETYGDLYKWKAIYEANKDKIPNPSAVPAGTVLALEKPMVPVTIERNGEKYLIKTGDTLGTISNDVYGTDQKWKRIWQNNKTMIKDPNLIFAGFYLYYTMTDQDRLELEQLKRQLAPNPLAAIPTSSDRLPASVGK